MANPPPPLSDGKISDSPRAGYVYACPMRFGGGGAFRDGPWINGDTWQPNDKISVSGNIHWPEAHMDIRVEGNERIISGNGLPNHATGEFPVQPTDAAYRYDRNPNPIAPQNILLKLPAAPQAAATPFCVGMGMIGVAISGVAIFNALDAMGRDAPAHEIQDRCGGHPERRGQYHYHTVSDCIADKSDKRHSGLFGYALDGFAIYGLLGETGQPLSNADLDACHGHTHRIDWDGKPTELYHYHLTAEYPYTIGCFHGAPVMVPGRHPPGPPPRR